MANKSLKKAKKSKNDEFYTQLTDIEKELKHYKNQFKGKVVFCNCDDPEHSNFWRYFQLNFFHIGLKKLISTHYEENRPTYKLEYDGKNITKTNLLQNGDFRSPEAIEILKSCDMVVTNPPFSLFREYVAQLIHYKKEFIIIGNQNALTYKDIFSLIKGNKMWTGHKMGSFKFEVPEHYNVGNIEIQDGRKYAKLGNIAWFTNLPTKKRTEELILHKQFDPDEFCKYENYDAININKTTDIPYDYFKPMGVPISFMDKYNPHQFEILALGIVGSCDFTSNRKMEILDKDGLPTGKYTYNAKGTLYKKYEPSKDKRPAFKDVETGQLYASIYARIIIKRKDAENKALTRIS